MNTWQLAEDFRTLIASFGVGGAWLHEQQAVEITRPSVTVSVSENPFSSDGKAGRFTLRINVHSQAHDTPAVDHQGVVAALRLRFFDPTEKVGTIAAMNAKGGGTRWALAGYSAGAEEPGEAGDAFTTVIIVTGTIRQLF